MSFFFTDMLCAYNNWHVASTTYMGGIIFTALTAVEITPPDLHRLTRSQTNQMYFITTSCHGRCVLKSF